MELVLAYIDPGSGSLIIQGIIAALVAVPVLFRNQIRRFANKVRGTDATDLTVPVATTARPRISAARYLTRRWRSRCVGIRLDPIIAEMPNEPSTHASAPPRTNGTLSRVERGLSIYAFHPLLFAAYPVLISTATISPTFHSRMWSCRCLSYSRRRWLCIYCSAGPPVTVVVPRNRDDVVHGSSAALRCHQRGYRAWWLPGGSGPRSIGRPCRDRHLDMCWRLLRQAAPFITRADSHPQQGLARSGGIGRRPYRCLRGRLSWGRTSGCRLLEPRHADCAPGSNAGHLPPRLRPLWLTVGLGGPPRHRQQ